MNLSPRRAGAVAFAVTISGQLLLAPAFAVSPFGEPWEESTTSLTVTDSEDLDKTAGHSGKVPPPFRDCTDEPMPETTVPEVAETPSETVTPYFLGLDENPKGNHFLSPQGAPREPRPLLRSGESEMEEPSAHADVDELESPEVNTSSEHTSALARRGGDRDPWPNLTANQLVNDAIQRVRGQETPGKKPTEETPVEYVVQRTPSSYTPVPQAPMAPEDIAPAPIDVIAEPTPRPGDAPLSDNSHPYRTAGNTGNLSPGVATTGLALMGLALIGGVIFTIGSSLTFRKD